jgi:hypothetical protein
MSQGGLSALGAGAGSGSGATRSLPLPLSLRAAGAGSAAAQASTSSASEAATGGRCDGSLSSAVSEDVAAVRNGRSNASLMRRTLTWPKPGRAVSWSEVAVAILAKLWIPSVSVTLRWPPDGWCTDAEGGAEGLDVRLVHFAD